MNRTLLKVPTVKEPPQRKYLFRTSCKVQGKVWKVIMDSGSTDNIASIEIVTKLNLQRIPHSHPYKVSCLNKGQQALISVKVWVEFLICEYKDRVLCDVVEMDACHFLLERPWKYDVDARNEEGIMFTTSQRMG